MEIPQRDNARLDGAGFSAAKLVNNFLLTAWAQYRINEQIEGKMKAMHKIVLVTVATFLAVQVQAVMYQLRPYEPNMARWLTRDPIGERGGLNLYGFVGNNPVGRIDSLGLLAVDIDIKVFIEADKISFGRQTFNGGTKVHHTIHANTDSETLTQDKYIGETIQYDQNGNVIAHDTASDSGLDASIICTKVKSPSGCPCKFCYIAAWGHAVNPLASPYGLPHWVVPGIDYDINAEVTTCPQSVTIHYTGDHDRFPSYTFSILGDVVHNYSSLTAGTGPFGLLPIAQTSFSGYINIMTQ